MQNKTIPGSQSLTSKKLLHCQSDVGKNGAGGYKIMGAVSSKKPCDRGGQSSTGQALPKNVCLQDKAA